MSTPSHYLRQFRKKTPLNQTDVASLLGLGVFSSVSRYESGIREPSIELLLISGLLYNVSLDQILEPAIDAAHSKLIQRIPDYIIELSKNKSDPKTELRILYLNQVLTRLTNANK